MRGLSFPPAQGVGLLEATSPPADGGLDLQGPLCSLYREDPGAQTRPAPRPGLGEWDQHLSSSPAEPTESSAPSGRFLLVAPQNLWASPSECRALGGDSQEAVVSNTPWESICSCESLAHPGPSLDKGEEGQSSHGSSW